MSTSGVLREFLLCANALSGWKAVRKRISALRVLNTWVRAWCRSDTLCCAWKVTIRLGTATKLKDEEYSKKRRTKKKRKLKISPTLRFLFSFVLKKKIFRQCTPLQVPRERWSSAMASWDASSSAVTCRLSLTLPKKLLHPLRVPSAFRSVSSSNLVPIVIITLTIFARTLRSRTLFNYWLFHEKFSILLLTKRWEKLLGNFVNLISIKGIYLDMIVWFGAVFSQKNFIFRYYYQNIRDEFWEWKYQWD